MGGHHAGFGTMMLQWYGKANSHFKMHVSNVRALMMQEIMRSKGDVTRDNSQRRFLAQQCCA